MEKQGLSSSRHNRWTVKRWKSGCLGRENVVQWRRGAAKKTAFFFDSLYSVPVSLLSRVSPVRTGNRVSVECKLAAGLPVATSRTQRLAPCVLQCPASLCLYVDGMAAKCKMKASLPRDWRGAFSRDVATD